MKYVKLQRQITKLQKEYDDVQAENQESNSHIVGQNIMENLPGISYTHLIINSFFYILQAILLFYLRNYYYTFSIKENQSNIIFEYYNINGEVRIPIYLIIIFESVFLNNAFSMMTRLI